MIKHLKTKGIVALAAILGVFSGPAMAQIGSNNQLASGGVLTAISGNDVTSVLSEFGITTALQPYEGDETGTMIASTSGGAQFFISFFNCADAPSATGCEQMLIYTGLPNAGISYDVLNTFNTNSDVSKAINVADQQIVIFGTQLFFKGGLGRTNVQLILALFLNDMQRYIDTQVTTGTAVSMLIGQAPNAKVENLSGTDGAVTVPEARLATGSSVAKNDFRTEKALSAAIANTLASEFADGNIKALISN